MFIRDKMAGLRGMEGASLRGPLLFLLGLGGLTGAATGPAFAAPETQPSGTAALQTLEQALAQDAAEYARREGVGQAEALSRLRFQEASTTSTDALRAEFGGRIAGIAIEHQPDYRIVVLLTGTEGVPDRFIAAADMTVPIKFVTGATATHDRLVAALRQHQMAMRAVLSRSQGMGVDPRTGEIVVLVQASDMDADQIFDKQLELSAMTGVPVRIRLINREDVNLAVEGGSRVAGVDPRDGRRYACTTGFVVTDASRTGIVTAAHCPDDLTYIGPDGVEVPLSFVGEWGATTQDVQVHVTGTSQKPEFYVDRERTQARALTSRRVRLSTRAGDIVCHRGESTGYSCSLVELVDFAPPGSLCGGPCEPVWVTVAGPSCRGGDSGGPTFAATTAFGIVKGASYRRSGECNFYYYMSVDYLPEGWSLLLQQ